MITLWKKISYILYSSKAIKTKTWEPIGAQWSRNNPRKIDMHINYNIFITGCKGRFFNDPCVKRKALYEAKQRFFFRGGILRGQRTWKIFFLRIKSNNVVLPSRHVTKILYKYWSKIGSWITACLLVSCHIGAFSHWLSYLTVSLGVYYTMMYL